MSRSITRWLAVLMALTGCIAAAAPAVAAAGSTIVRPDDPRLRFMGHWGHTANAAITVNSGSELTFGFTGHTLHGLFDTSTITVPSQIYVSIDAGPPVFYKVDHDDIDFTPTPLAGFLHTHAWIGLLANVPA